MTAVKTTAKKRGKKFPLVLAALLLGAAGTGYYFWQQHESEKVTYRSIPVEYGDIDVTLLATGTVQPQNRLDIKAPVAGRMEQIYVHEGDKVTKGQVIASMSSTERAAMLDAASAKGPAEAKVWADMYLPTPVMAPISGTIIQRNIEPGQTFTTADAIITMSDRLAVKAQADETDISKIKLKQSAEIVLDAYPDKKIPGEVGQIAFDAKTVNSVTTYIADVLPQFVPDYMRSGMTANVTFFVESKKHVVVIANEALQVKDGKTVLLMKGPNDEIQNREIQVGVTDGKNTEILSGAEVGDVALIAVAKKKSERKGINPFSPMGGARPRGTGGGSGGSRRPPG